MPHAHAPAAEASAATVAADVFDAGAPWQLHPQVSLRPEPFGALAYHFGTRRLSFLKTRRLVDVVEALAAHPDALGACDAAGVTADELPVYRRALASLAGSGMICRRVPPPEGTVAARAAGTGSGTAAGTGT